MGIDTQRAFQIRPKENKAWQGDDARPLVLSAATAQHAQSCIFADEMSTVRDVLSSAPVVSSN
jgi:hypothetical protein